MKHEVTIESKKKACVYRIVRRGVCNTWTLDSGLDHGLDHGLDYGLDWTMHGLDYGLDWKQ